VGRAGSTDPRGCLSSRLHGLRHHSDCHNPKTFLVDYPGPGRFVVGVAGVSGYGGADLHISLDDREVLFGNFVDEDAQLKNVMQQYRGPYGIDVPEGGHEIKVANRGNDWIEVSHVRLTNYGASPPRVQAMGLRGKTTALVWLRNADYTWYGHATQLALPYHRGRSAECAGAAVRPMHGPAVCAADRVLDRRERGPHRCRTTRSALAANRDRPRDCRIGESSSPSKSRLDSHVTIPS